METVAWVFRIRWVLWAVGGLGLAGIIIKLLRWPRWSVDDRRFNGLLFTICLVFFALASLAKWTQLWSGSLNAQDFWLFEDMLRQMTAGAPFVTRFAPQGTGWVQHGAVHGMFIWYLILPLSWLIGATAAALLFEPLVFGLAGFVLGQLCRPRVGAFHALLVSAAFLLSSQVGKTLMYDVHPEAAYPLFVFLWAWAIGMGNGKVRWLWLVVASFAGMSIKEDAFLVFLPLMAWVAWRAWRSRLLGAVALSVGVAALSGLVQLLAVNRWAQGSWGPLIWQGAPVIIPKGPDLFGGRHWDSVGSALQIISDRISIHGGWSGVLKAWVHYLFSRPWLSFVAIFPWVVLNAGFWISLLPLALAYALLAGAGTLYLYYSAAFIGTFWVIAVDSLNEKRLHWLVIAVLLIGSGGLEFYFSSDGARQLREQTQTKVSCLEKIQGQGQEPSPVLGLVNTPLIGLVPREHVWAAQVPSDEDLDRLKFVLLATHKASFEMPVEKLAALLKRLSSDKNWIRFNDRCEPAPLNGTTDKLDETVSLFMRKKR